MKFSLFAVSALFAGAFAAPAANAEQKRQVGQVVGLVEGLAKDVTGLTGHINDITAGVGLAGVGVDVKVDIEQTLNTVVDTVFGVVEATKAIDLVDDITGDVENYVAGLLSSVIKELNDVVGTVEGVVGLGDVTNQVTGIVSGLGSLFNVLQGLGLQNILTTVTNLLSVLPIGQVTGVVSGLGLPLKL